MNLFNIFSSHATFFSDIHLFSRCKGKNAFHVGAFLLAGEKKIICSNFSLNLPRRCVFHLEWELREEKNAEKINDAEDSVKNASLPYIIAIKKKRSETTKWLSAKSLLYFSFPLSHQLVIYFTKMCFTTVEKTKLMEKVWHFHLMLFVISLVF